MKILFKIFYTFIIFFSSLYAQATYTEGSTASALASQIEGVGITITNPVITYGANTQRGIFSNGVAGAGLEIESGIILTTMDVDQSFHPNEKPSYSVSNPNNNDLDLMNIDVKAKYNTIVFEFDVTLDANTRLLLIDYQFASEEYPEYVGSQYNDAFGFFVSGGDLNQTYNIARVIDDQTYVTIDNINNYKPVTVNNVNVGLVGANDDPTPEDLTNSAFFIDNNQKNIGGTSPVIIEYDGITHSLHATLDNLTPNTTYHFKMAIADTGDSNLNTGVFVNKIVGLREPSICYDYAYKQNGLYLTEKYNNSKGPFINGDVVPNDSSSPVEVIMYIKNTTQSEIIASGVTFDITDINTTQAKYKTNSVYVIEPGSVYTDYIPDTLLDVGPAGDFVKDIPITSFDAFDYFYIYLSIDPSVTNLNFPIISRINYNLEIPLSATQTVKIPRSSLIDAEIPICGGGTSDFNPAYGLFNIIENGFFTDNNNYFYNINTQVTKREADLSIVTVDANKTVNNDLHTLIAGVDTVVGIDMLDLSSFHYTGASCSETNNSISDRVWTTIKGNAVTPFVANSADFYSIARENVALRIGYITMGANNEILQLEKLLQGGFTRWNIANFSTEVQNANCGSSSITPQAVSSWCTSSGTPYPSAMDETALQSCMQCLYGVSTRFICARDNFAIRPEAFLINLDDQNQTKPTQSQLITNNISGVSTPIGGRVNTAAGYAYKLEVNATNHQDNIASMGYNLQLGSATGTSSALHWTPRTGQIVTGCNDTNDTNVTTKFINGNVDSNISFAQVGDYIFSLIDTSWTSIDSTMQSHHTGAYFTNTRDCILNSSFVDVSKSGDQRTGCDISSTHLSSSDSNLAFVDLNLSVHPYKFKLSSILPTTGTMLQALPTAPLEAFVYMADMFQNNYEDQNMSFHLNGKIEAVGYNNATLSNFVDRCYAKPIDINISRSDNTLLDRNRNPVLYQLNFSNLDNNGTIIIADILDINDTNLTLQTGVTIPATYFTKTLNGVLDTRLNLNYDRNLSLAANPKMIHFTDYNVSCTNTLDCQFNAELSTSHETNGSLNINRNVIHYYARNHSPRYRFTDNNGTAFIYYEVYCSGVDCNTTLLQNGVDSNTTDDPRWFVNTRHTNAFGSAGVITQRGNSIVSGTTTTGNHLDSSFILYDGTRGYPYKTTMNTSSSNWLIYNRYNPNATTNSFNVEFTRDGSWAGVHETNTHTPRNAATQTNRRSMW